MSHGASPRHPSFRSGAAPNATPGLDEAEVLRSPRAHSVRSPGFDPYHPTASTSYEPAARLRPKTSMPDSPNSSILSSAHSLPENRSYYPDPGLSIRTTRSDVTGRLLHTPTTWRSRVASTTIYANKVIILVCLLALASTALVVRRLAEDPAAYRLDAPPACEPGYPTIEARAPMSDLDNHDPSHIPVRSRPAIAIVTMHDSRKMPMPKELSYMTGIEAGRNVDVLDVVYKNRKEYADRHGYTLVDGSALVGTIRPPAWYKIKAVEDILDEYDWVFWLDPDAWITNPDIKLETVLPAAGTQDLVVTIDITGFNAGSWILRSSDWSRQFLKDWWNHSELIRSFSDKKSGDNDALKHMLNTMPRDEFEKRIAVPPQCSLNSYLWRPSIRQWMRLVFMGGQLRSGFWKPGHLLVHMAGWSPTAALLRLQHFFLNADGISTSHALPGLPRLSRKLIAAGNPPPQAAASTTAPDDGDQLLAHEVTELEQPLDREVVAQLDPLVPVADEAAARLQAGGEPFDAAAAKFTAAHAEQAARAATRVQERAAGTAGGRDPASDEAILRDAGADDSAPQWQMELDDRPRLANGERRDNAGSLRQGFARQHRLFAPLGQQNRIVPGR